MEIYVLDNFTLTDELFANDLQTFESGVLVSNSVCGKSVWSFPVKFIGSSKVNTSSNFLLVVSIYQVAD